jgi:hypothetical protein
LNPLSQKRFVTDLRGESLRQFLPLISLDDRSERGICHLKFSPVDGMPIPMKVVDDSDLNPVAGSEVKPGVFGAKRRWRSYPA